MKTLLGALAALADSFCGSSQGSAFVDFMKAYVHGGTVINPCSTQRGLEEDIHTGKFLQNNRGSHRSATMPRDYIFATMPSFPWYTYPKKDALTMSFGEIYLDLYQQAARTGHAFTCRLTRSMVDATCTDPISGWLPSRHLPSPTKLGDFLNLVEQRVPECSNASSPHVHVTLIVQIQELQHNTDPEFVLDSLEACVKDCKDQWGEASLSGELKFDSGSNQCSKLNYSGTTSCGCVLCNLASPDPIDEHTDRHHLTCSDGLGLEADNAIPNLRSLNETNEDMYVSDPGKYIPLFLTARNILYFLMIRPQDKAKGQSEWTYLRQKVQASWSLPFLRAVLLLAAMVNCRIPLSAAAWVNKRFVPVYIRHGELLVSVGLLAKHARQPKGQRSQPKSLLCVGQHIPYSGEKPFGTDLFLVDAKTKVPVGIVPDLMPNDRTNEQQAKVTPVLYNGFWEDAGNNDIRIAINRLCNMKSSET
jgi:hypothetical protein